MDSTRAEKFSWVLIDWANSGYGLIIITAVFPPYFISTLLPPMTSADGSRLTGLNILGTPVPGSAIWGLLTSVSMLLMAIAAPVMGAIADIKGWTKVLLVVHTVVGSLLTIMMYFLFPGQWILGAILYVASNYCFGASYAFFNAYLPKLAPPEKQGSLSGWGFAAGYIGGALALIIVLVALEKTRTSDGYSNQVLRLSLALPGIWWLLFSLPAFFTLKEFEPAASTERVSRSLLTEGFHRVLVTLGHLRKYGMLFLFLLSFLLYNDGVETVIAMSSPFGTEVLHMQPDAMIKMLLIVQFVAFVGSVLFGYLSDKFGNKAVILINLLIWIIAVGLALLVQTSDQFIWLGVLIGLVLGGVQASSRALMSLLSPPEILNEAFGFFSISGKFASIFGPLLYSVFVTWFGSRMGILSVLPFLISGMILLWYVQEPRRAASA